MSEVIDTGLVILRAFLFATRDDDFISWKLTKEGQEGTDDDQTIETIQALVDLLEGDK